MYHPPHNNKLQMVERVWMEKPYKFFFITPRVESKQTRSLLPCWRMSRILGANHKYIFCECQKLNLLRKKRWMLWFNIYLYTQYHNILKQCILEVSRLSVKKAIINNWYKISAPSIQQWFRIVGEIYTMEQMTFILWLKEDKCTNKCGKRILYDTKKGKGVNLTSSLWTLG